MRKKLKWALIWSADLAGGSAYTVLANGGAVINVTTAEGTTAGNKVDATQALM